MEFYILRFLCNVKVSKIIIGLLVNYVIVLDSECIFFYCFFKKLMVFFLLVYGVIYFFGCFLVMVQFNGVILESIFLKIFFLLVGLLKGIKWVNGVVGRSYFFLVDSKGDVWGCGNNVFG